MVRLNKMYRSMEMDMPIYFYGNLMPCSSCERSETTKSSPSLFVSVPVPPLLCSPTVCRLLCTRTPKTPFDCRDASVVQMPKR
jgi:hypothetical protein